MIEGSGVLVGNEYAAEQMRAKHLVPERDPKKRHFYYKKPLNLVIGGAKDTKLYREMY